VANMGHLDKELLMNERIEELAGQAFQFAADNADETGKGQLGVFAEKFAELLIKECTAINLKELSFTAYALLHEKYCEHFGVEE